MSRNCVLLYEILYKKIEFVVTHASYTHKEEIATAAQQQSLSKFSILERNIKVNNPKHTVLFHMHHQNLQTMMSVWDLSLHSSYTNTGIPQRKLIFICIILACSVAVSVVSIATLSLLLVVDP